MDRDDRSARRRADTSDHPVDDAAVRLAYELATKPPTKDVASIKAASDVFEANLEKADREPRRSQRR